MTPTGYRISTKEERAATGMYCDKCEHYKAASIYLGDEDTDGKCNVDYNDPMVDTQYWVNSFGICPRYTRLVKR